MSYQIYYDKRFLKIDGKICPLVQSGSNNCFQMGTCRYMPEKSWNVLNYPRKNQLLFTEKELTELFNEPEYKETHHKSRNSCFDDFSKWLIAGIKSAMTIEEHSSLGNSLMVVGQIQCDDNLATEKTKTEKFYIKNKEDFYVAIELLKSINATRLDVKFKQRDINKPKRNSSAKPKKEAAKYFLLYHESAKKYFVKKRKYGLTWTSMESYAKKFRYENDAKKYKEKYDSVMKDFTIVEINTKKEAD